MYAKARCTSYSSEFQGSVWHRLNLADNATARNKKPGVRGSKIKDVYPLDPTRNTTSLRVEKIYIRTSIEKLGLRPRIVCAAATTSRKNRCKSDRDVNKVRRCISKPLVRSARAWIHAACGYNKSVET